MREIIGRERECAVRKKMKTERECDEKERKRRKIIC
jgi:hypothetical protein